MWRYESSAGFKMHASFAASSAVSNSPIRIDALAIPAHAAGKRSFCFNARRNVSTACLYSPSSASIHASSIKMRERISLPGFARRAARSIERAAEIIPRSRYTEPRASDTRERSSSLVERADKICSAAFLLFSSERKRNAG